MYKCNIEVHSQNYCCIRKVISITYSECVALIMQHELRMRHIVICGLSGPTVFSHIIS